MNLFAVVKNKIVPVLTAVSILLGGILWLTNLHASTTENTQQISDIKGQQETQMEYLIDIIRRLSVIEGKLDKQNKSLLDDDGE